MFAPRSRRSAEKARPRENQLQRRASRRFASASFDFLEPRLLLSAVMVTNTNDSGPGSLRAAVAGASAGDTIMVPAGDYGLTSGEIEITEPMPVPNSTRETVVAVTGA